MGFQFAETMAGTVEWEAKRGTRHPFRFDITAQADSTRRHFGDGRAVVRGLLHAPPIAEGVDLDGVIIIRPIGQRIIRYELAFVGGDRRRYEMIGQKDIRWRSPLKTFTYLPAEILDDEHRRVATCELSFDLKDTWSFLRSFRPLGRGAGSPRPGGEPIAGS